MHTTMTKAPMSVRLEEDVLARLDALAAALSKRAAGAEVNRSDALRVAALRGVEDLERELGIKRTKR